MHTPPQLSSMQAASNKRTQRVKVTKNYPLYLVGTKKNRWTERGRTLGSLESTMFKENIVKKRF